MRGRQDASPSGLSPESSCLKLCIVPVGHPVDFSLASISSAREERLDNSKHHFLLKLYGSNEELN